MTKPRKLAVGIGVAAVACAALALLSPAPLSWLWAWTSLSCALAAAAYVANRPALYGKRDGRMVWWRALPCAPFLVAFRIACGLMRVWRQHPVKSRITPRLWVAGRIVRDQLPSDLDFIIDLVAESSEPAAVRAHPGYRSLSVLDGGVPPDDTAVLELVEKLGGRATKALVHCDSGIGRAPTFAALVLLRWGDAANVDEAVALIERERPFVHLGSADRAFLARVAPRVRRSGRENPRAAAAS